MNVSDFGILGFIILLIFMLTDCIHSADITSASFINEQMNQAIDNAVESALFEIVEYDDREKPVINHEIVIQRFLDNLYMNLGIMEQSNKKQQINFYLPVFFLIDTDAIFVYKQRIEEHKGEKHIVLCDKKEFLFEGNTGKLYFSLNQCVRFKSMHNTVMEGYYYDIKSELPDDLKWDLAEFEEIRRNKIIEVIKDTATVYLNEYNRIAKKYNIHYHFSLPVIRKEEWYRTIENVSLMIFFQGYPYGNGETGYYSRVAFGTAAIKKSG